MTVRLYEVTATVMRDEFRRAMVTVWHVAASTRQGAIKIVRDRLYTDDADAVTIVGQSLGACARVQYRQLVEPKP